MHQLLKLERMEGLLILITFRFFWGDQDHLKVVHCTGDNPLYAGFLMLTVIPIFVLIPHLDRAKFNPHWTGYH
jgi:hypothetical protein